MSEKYPKSISELPTKPSFAIIEINSVSYPDPYEDSGRGSTITDYHPTLIVFDDEEEWKKEIARRMDVTQKFYSKKEFMAYKMLPASVSMSVNVEVKEWQS